MQRDLPSLQQELPVVRADQGHGIGDQHQSVATLAAKGNTQGGGSTWMPSQMIPANSLSSSRAAPTSPGSRAFNCDMALNRWVTPRHRDRPPGRFRLRLPRYGRPRYATRRRSVHRSWTRARIPVPRSPESGRSSPKLLSAARSRRSGTDLGLRMNTLARPVQGRSFQMKSKNAGNLQTSWVRLSANRSMTSVRSLMRVGKQPVVPALRCASTMRRTPASVGWSLRRTPPPPLTCMSTNPGARIASDGNWMDAREAASLEADAFNPAIRNSNRSGPAQLGAIKDVLRRNRKRGKPEWPISMIRE